ncbi:ABC transporter family substrate-binding protein [Salinibacterium sp. ZJ450]|uniref:ABC transporter family substrate-binding protein n=1 Tax=Salinibacterium sp. ZJ450 TaxID=2708338 RepID=UPI0014246C63|nr:ABC transporter family substrate-binding protein [Salinibacterium sp. ZJ450]
MTGRRRAALLATVTVGALALLSGCSPDSVVEGSSISVELAAPFTSLNDATGYGNTATNTAVAYATGADFTFYDNTASLVRDESFGRIEVVADEPFAVRYTVAEGVTWSDGVPVDAADLLLSWAANSGALNTPGLSDDDVVDDATGAYRDDAASDVVFFDGALNSGLQHVSQTPQIGNDGRSITLVYDQYFADWELAFSMGLPAHVVAESALTLESGAEDSAADSKQRMIDAIVDRTADLAPISRMWSSGFTAEELRAHPDRLVTSGPYTLNEPQDGEPVRLTVNERYSGEHRPRYERIDIHSGGNPLESVQRLANGDVDVITPQPSGELQGVLNDTDGVRIAGGHDAVYEHLDLRFANSRNQAIENPLVRQALLTVLPRQQIVDELVATGADADAGAPRDSFVLMPGSAGYQDAVDSNGSAGFTDPDVKAATRLLAEAGVTAPEVCVLFDPANPRRVQEFQLIRDAAAPAGFVVSDCSDPNWLEMLGDPGAYDAALFAWRSTNSGVTGLSSRLHSTEGATNFSFYASAPVDGLLGELAISRDSAEQEDLLAAIDEQLWADGYGAPLYQYPQLVAHDESVDGIVPSPMPPGVFWNVWEWQPAGN